MTELVCRRTVLRGAAVAAGSCLLAACGGADETEPSAQTPQESTDTSAAPSESESTGGGGGGEVLASLDDIPVGEAISAKAGDSPILLVRTSESEVIGLSAVCTHQQCTVAPAGDALACPCHGSRYDLTGKVTQGPAPAPLKEFPVTVQDGSVVAA
jgi:cytochrome b6-f complex iron-sulfur subunit